MKKGILIVVSCLSLLLSTIPTMFTPPMALAAGTTSVTVTKYDQHGNIIGTQTVTWEWMRDNLPVYGDGIVHYYCEGPNFDEARTFNTLWDPTETGNIDSRDYGAAMGTDIKDLCNLVGGALPGDAIITKSEDGWNRTWDYENIYTPDPRFGRLVLTWYTTDAMETSSGYVPDDYSTGMKLLFFSNVVDSSGRHVFGNYDAYQTIPENRWYYYSDGQYWPTTSGLSGKWIIYIEIRQPKMISCDASGNTKESFAPGETVYVKGKGLSKNTGYKLWIQPEPAVLISSARGDTVPGATVPGPMNNSIAPSGSQESVTTDASGDFGPVAIWAVSSSAAQQKYDIVADNQAGGTLGSFDTSDAADSPGFQGFIIAGTYVPPTSPTTQTPVQPQAPAWDLNGDHVCNISDLETIGLQWGKKGTAGWIKEDVNKDGSINISDIVTVGLNFGKTW